MVSGSAIPDRAVGAGLSTTESSGARRNKEVHNVQNREKPTEGEDASTVQG